METEIKTIAVFGATGMLGRPVVLQLLAAGYAVRALVRQPAQAQLPAAVQVVPGDLHDAQAVATTLQGCQGVYLSLSIPYAAKESEWLAEREGLATVLQQARLAGVQRVVYLSSLISRFAKMADWWVFRVKNEAVQAVENSGIPFTIFYPSMFFDTIPGKQLRGTAIGHAGRGQQPIWPIAAADYGRQVARSYALPQAAGRHLSVQGPQQLLPEEILAQFVTHYPHARLKVQTLPMWLFQLLGRLVPAIGYTPGIVHAINTMPEPFESQETWDLLGQPSTTIAQYAAALPRP